MHAVTDTVLKQVLAVWQSNVSYIKSLFRHITRIFSIIERYQHLTIVSILAICQWTIHILSPFIIHCSISGPLVCCIMLPLAFRLCTSLIITSRRTRNAAHWHLGLITQNHYLLWIAPRSLCRHCNNSWFHFLFRSFTLSIKWVHVAKPDWTGKNS